MPELSRPQNGDEVVADVLKAIEAADWEGVRPTLHPYLTWTFPDGAKVKGRNRVIERLERSQKVEPPSSYELRDGQVYRWEAQT